MNIRTLERYNKVTVFKLSIKKEQGTRFVAPAHNRNLVQSLAAESGAAAQYSAAALIMRWFLPSTGMIDLHGKQCIQSMSLTIARFMAVQIHVEVKKNPEFKKWMQTVVWSRINISKNIKPLERSVIISPSAEILWWKTCLASLCIYISGVLAQNLAQKYGIIKSLLKHM